MAKDVGQTILDAAQQVVAQFTQQNQLQLQQLAMEQQFAVQSQLMDLRQKQADAQGKLNDLQFQAAQLDLENKRKQTQLFEAQGGVAGAVTRSQSAAELERRETEAKIGLTIAQTEKARQTEVERASVLGVAALKPSEKIDLRAKVIASAEDVHEQEALASIVNGNPAYHKYGLLSMEDLKETQREINRVATRGMSITELLQVGVISNNERLSSAIRNAQAQGVDVSTLQKDLTGLIKEAAGAIAEGPSEETLKRAAVSQGVLVDDLGVLFPGGYSSNPARSAAAKVFGTEAMTQPGFYPELQQDFRAGNHASVLNKLLNTGALQKGVPPSPEQQAKLRTLMIELAGGDVQKAATFFHSVALQLTKEQ